MTNANLNLVAGLDRSLAWYSGNSVRYVVATVEADQDDSSAERPPMPANVALVIDASGSMSGAKLESAKRAAQGVIKALGPQDVLSVVSFAGEVLLHVDGMRMDDSGQADALSAVGKLEPRGNTNLSEGWFTGAACVARGMTAGPGMAHRVIVLSDGQANDGITSPSELAEHAGVLQVRGITTSTVGIGDDYETAVLQALAEQGGGQMHDAERAEDIVDILLGELRETQAAAIEQAVVTFDLPDKVQATPVGFYQSTREPGRLLVRLGSIALGRPRNVVVRLTLPEGEVDDTLTLRADAFGVATGTERAVTTSPQELAVKFVRGAANDAQVRDERLSVLVAESWHAQVVHAVAGMNRSGERRQARHFLERELRYFERYCRGLSGTEKLVGELALMIRHVDTEWNERTRKVMQYESVRAQRQQADFRIESGPTWSERLTSEPPRV